MKLLFYLHRYPEFGGIEKVTEVLSEYLVNRGYNISILSYIQNIRTFNKNNKISYYKMPESSFTSHQNIQYTKRLVKEKKFDIIIFQDSYAPIENTLFEAIQDTSTKLIIAEHNSPNCGYDSFWGSLRHNHSIKNLVLAPYHYWYMVTHTTKRYKILYAKADTYVLLSQKFLPVFKKRSGLNSIDKCCWINNPITIPHNNQNIHKEKIVLFAGRFTAQKGIGMLLKIWEMVYAQHPDWTLKIIGDGELKPNILNFIKRNRIPNVILTGYQKEMLPYYQEASILCQTSIFEGWGLVLTEAMSQGVIPIIFNSYESASDIIDDRQNGILIQPFKLHLFASQLSLLMDNPELRNFLSTYAISKSERFSIKKIGKEWESLIAKTCNK